MADAFAPQLGSEVRFNQPVENTSTATAISGLGSILGAFIEPKKEETKGPMGSASNPDIALANYTKELSDIMQTAQDVSPNALAVNIRKLNVRYAGEGFDVTGPAFKSARESITGRQEETLIFTQEELVFNDLIKTPEGQAKLALAERELMSQSGGTKPSGADTINYIIKQEAEKQAFDRLKIENEMSYLAAAPQFQMQVSNMGKQFLASLDIIEENGLRTDDPEMLQNSYLSYQAERNRIISKIPLGLPNREQEIKNLFQVTDEFFSSMGIDAGKFERLPKSQLDLKRKAIVAVEMLNSRGDAASAMLATGILNADYKMSDDTMLLVQSVLGENALVNTTPEWITDAGIVVSNDMVTVAQQLSTIGAQAIRTVADHEAALTDLVGADVAEKWGSLTSEQAWKDLQATTGIYKGFSRDAILNGQVSTDIPYQMAFKLAMGLKTIDFENEAVSFGGLRKSVDASLPSTLDALEAKDPEKGKAARTLLYVATGKAARQYEAQITAEEQRFGMSFNPSIRGYSFNYATIADENNRQIISRIVEEQYGGDIIRAVEDKFARAGGGALRYGKASTTTGAALAALPSVDDMKRLLDLRNSAVYLDSLSRSIEPEDFRVAREMGRDAFSTTEAQAIGMGAIEAIANAPLPGEITTETIPAGGAGGGSVSTANQITYALPDAIAADTEFLDKVVSVSSELGFDPNDLLRVIDFETAGSFSPKAQPIRKDGTKISSATGLIQFLESTAKGLGTTTADLANMTAVEQMDFVKAYFEPFKGRIKNFGDIYMAVHWPAGVGKDDSYVMYKKGSDSYNSNKNLDTNGDGTVTRGETLARLFSATGKGGNPTAGTPANENTVAAAAGPAVQRAVTSTSSVPMTMASGGAPTAPMETATAELPENIPTDTAAGGQEVSQLSAAIAVDPDVQAFIQEIAGDPDKTYASDAEFLAAQERGELEPGDTVVVNGDVYVIRKNGTARRLGTANA